MDFYKLDSSIDKSADICMIPLCCVKWLKVSEWCPHSTGYPPVLQYIKRNEGSKHGNWNFWITKNQTWICGSRVEQEKNKKEEKRSMEYIKMYIPNRYLLHFRRLFSSADIFQVFERRALDDLPRCRSLVLSNKLRLGGPCRMLLKFSL